MDTWDLKDRFYLREMFIIPALTSYLIQMTIPYKSRNSKQKYIITIDGKKLIQPGIAMKEISIFIEIENIYNFFRKEYF